MPTALDFSPTYFSTSCVCYLHCSYRKTGGRSSIMCLPCFSLEEQSPGQGLGTDLKSGDLSKIMCSSFNRHAHSWAPKNATHWCCGFQKSPPSMPVFFLEILRGAPDVVLIWFGLNVAAASFTVSRTLCSRKSRPNRRDNKIIPAPSELSMIQSWLQPQWDSVWDAGAALLIFSSLHSYKLFTGLSHVPATMHVGVWRLSFPFYCLCQPIPLFSQLERPEGAAGDKVSWCQRGVLD